MTSERAPYLTQSSRRTLCGLCYQIHWEHKVCERKAEPAPVWPVPSIRLMKRTPDSVPEADQ